MSVSPECGVDGPAVTEQQAEALVEGVCFKTGPPRSVGVEVEWLVHRERAPHEPVGREELAAAHADLRDLPLTSGLSIEPGGQVELSSRPAPSLAACVSEVSADLDAVRTALHEHGLALAGMGVDPWQRPRRFLRERRYDAMEACLDRTGRAGRTLMCTSASVQVCLDGGREEPGVMGFARRWWLAHHLGAVLVAVFANSPMAEGRPTGWLSTRQLMWAELDPGRAGGPSLSHDPRHAWVRRVLDAPVMCVRRDGPWEVPDGVSFREWTRSRTMRPPTHADLEYHISTLFPPVRPRGHLELRMIDAQPGDDGWIVPLAVVTALFDDPGAAAIANRAVTPLAERGAGAPAPHNPLWTAAARHGLADPGLRRAAVTCFAAALDALPRLGASTGVVAAVAAYADRYVARGRCPADDVLDREAPARLRAER
ncbi:ergothioneine biosynthesis glutamate--cysteine ligase EgtA [Streptomyces sp. Ag109_O5-10]|uniref:ergothioneine biosynthesis glutamate--cysteine ligase EgtA n=1 Tax=Streptomyces sp. Ag109_O5-10 TaxID=1855349 RepID=UPI00089A974E|nr:ergothioneine biosynthesis glutamate--cysteine ligase EgtA [Streptomyces sp. Ag109_O5-10]SEF16932.1 glutamate--cysteine ligase [Streptomyces sp. Ag109_O5-10]